jgi:NAD(P)H-flavin reductase
MRRSFERVAANGDEVALFFYSHLFLSHPETRSMFPVSMMQQRDRLLTALGHIVAKVDEVDDLVPYLQQLGRDHRKFGTLAAHYPAVGESLLTTLAHFAGRDWTPELEDDWRAAYELIAKVMVEGAQEADSEPAFWRAEVVHRERPTFDITVLRVRPESPLPYEPGQSVSLETELRPRMWRFYSIANAPRDDGVLEFHVQAMDGGPVSSALARRIGVGDVLKLGPPVGTMTLDAESDRDVLMLGGGTGLAPLKAIVEQVANLDVPRRVHMFVGARTPRGLYHLDELNRLAEEHRWFTVTPAVSHDPGFDGECGMLSDVVVRHGPWRSWDAYVCGSPRMVDATAAHLEQDGMPATRIRCEEFAPSWPGPRVEEG